MSAGVEALVRELTERRPTGWLLALGCALYLPWLGAEPVATALESLRLLAAREMLESGDWVVPRLDGRPYLAKPPLVYWAIAGVSAPFAAVTPLAGRLVSVAATLATMLLVAWWVRRRLGARAAFLAAVVTGLSGLAFEKGSLAELESLLLFATTLALVAFFEACRSEGPRRMLVALAVLGLGAAVLTKGPVPLVAFGAATAGLLAAGDRRGRTVAIGCAVLAGAALVCVPWVAALAIRFEGDELRRVLDIELLRRVEEADATNIEPFWYYPPALARGLLPWTFLLPGLAALRGAVALRTRSLLGFLLGWSVLTLAALSLSSGKEVRYLLPTYPAWGTLVAWGWTERGRVRGLLPYGRTLLAATLAASWLLPVALPLAAARLAPQSLASVLALSAALFAGRVGLELGARRAAAGMTAAGLLITIAATRGTWGELRAASRAVRHPYVAIGAAVREHVAEGETLLALGRVGLPVRFYGERPIQFLADEADLDGCRAEDACAGRVLLADRPLGAGAAREIASWRASGRRPFYLYELPSEALEARSATRDP